MDKIFYTLLFFLVYAGVIIMMVPAIRDSQRSRVLFILFWSFYMAVQVMFFAHLVPVRFGAELSSIRWATMAMGDEQAEAQRFLGENCTLVDVSRDIELMPVKDVADDSLVEPITHRERLANLIEYLARHSDLFDLLLLDVYFQHAHPLDERLRASLDRLEAEGRLAMAHVHGSSTAPMIHGNDGLRNAYGDVEETLVSDLYFQHALLDPHVDRPASRRFSLPYRAYTRIAGVDSLSWVNHVIGVARERDADGWSWISLRHTPLFLMGAPAKGPATDWVEMMGFEDGPGPIREDLVIIEQSIIERAAQPLSRLTNEIARDPEAPFLRAMLEQRHSARGPHLIAVGNFLNKERDVHGTVQGDMLGAVMVVDLIHELLHHRHRAPFQAFLVVWSALALVVALLVYRCLKVANGVAERSKGHGVKRMLTQLFNSLFVTERHYWFLFLVLFCMQVLMHRVINIMAFVLLLVIMEMLLLAFLPRATKET